jgi:hypothetical protein
VLLSSFSIVFERNPKAGMVLLGDSRFRKKDLPGTGWQELSELVDNGLFLLLMNFPRK